MLNDAVKKGGILCQLCRFLDLFSEQLHRIHIDSGLSRTDIDTGAYMISLCQGEYLDVRTITMGISLIDCADADIDKSCAKIYEKITRVATQPVHIFLRSVHISTDHRRLPPAVSQSE